MLFLCVNYVNKSTRPLWLWNAWYLTDLEGIHRGMGLHVQDITYAPVAKVIYNLKLHLFAAELIYAACLAFGQVSILCLYWRIFSVPEARLTVKVLLPFTLVWVIVRVSLWGPPFLTCIQLISHLSRSSS